MRLLARLGGTDTAIAALTAVTALYMALVVLGNITDPDANTAYVRHVLAMDTTFDQPPAAWRAITHPAAVTVVFVGIVAWEAAIALVLTAALAVWFRRPESARRLASLGWVLQILLFGGGFLAVGGEWFQMWQSAEWNGTDPAVRNVLIAGIGLILVHTGRAHRAGSPQAAPDGHDATVGRAGR
ncbi:DUF2165 domain-containing protein [Marinactinospora rubrisoli]|uniref:DUF2165 domain-containing protein n=1 Tax=Marinactinospora rubrisoli TaxID=2715399 RepID=A0ABW2KJJ2_9ACTN